MKTKNKENSRKFKTKVRVTNVFLKVMKEKSGNMKSLQK